MSKKATTTLLLASLYFMSLGGVLGYGFYLIHKEGATLEAARIAMSEQAAKETAYTNVIRQTESTKSDRTELASFFITEKDTVSFIAELEKAATTIGVTFETTGLSVVPSKEGKPAELSVDCKFAGSEAGVRTFLLVLETIPYRTTVMHVLITKQSVGGGAEGQVQFKITLKP